MFVWIIITIYFTHRLKEKTGDTVQFETSTPKKRTYTENSWFQSIENSPKTSGIVNRMNHYRTFDEDEFDSVLFSNPNRAYNFGIKTNYPAESKNSKNSEHRSVPSSSRIDPLFEQRWVASLLSPNDCMQFHFISFIHTCLFHRHIRNDHPRGKYIASMARS